MHPFKKRIFIMRPLCKVIMFGLLVISFSPTYAIYKNFFLCGSDEDGCNKAKPDAGCLCIPRHHGLSKKYCLTFTTKDVKCIPLLLSKNCPAENIIKNQRTCVALAFQSEPTPACPRVTYRYCHKHGIKRIHGFFKINTPN